MNRRNGNLQKKKNAVESVFTVEDQRAANIGRQWRLEIPKNLLLTEARNQRSAQQSDNKKDREAVAECRRMHC